jgi:hypothetical protein
MATYMGVFQVLESHERYKGHEDRTIDQVHGIVRFYAAYYTNGEKCSKVHTVIFSIQYT